VECGILGLKAMAKKLKLLSITVHTLVRGNRKTGRHRVRETKDKRETARQIES
jgi:hypothetical protein